MSKLSFILPTFNAQKTVERAIDSILKMNRYDVEVLVVDDHSTDSTVDLIKSHPNFNRIQLLELTENVGQAEARNIGLRHVSSEYVGFLDSDDYFTEKAVESLFDVLNKSNPDMIIFRYKKLLENGQLSDSIGGQSVGSMYTAVWNKVFNRKIIDNIFFPKDAYFEDVAFSARARLRADEANVTFINNALYVYVQNETSLIHSAYKEVHESSIIEALEPLVKEIKQDASESPFRADYEKLVNSIVLLHTMGPAKTFQARGQLSEWVSQIDMIYLAQDKWFPGKKEYSDNILVNVKNKLIVVLNKHHLFALSNILFRILGVLE